MIFQLMGGIVVAGGIFVALLWSVYQGVTQRGRLQYAHIAAAVLCLAGMASISLLAFSLSQILGILLLATATTAVILETRWNRVLPLFQVAFAIALILGLPFTAQ